jgi:methyl-accepting chemotaxis protein
MAMQRTFTVTQRIWFLSLFFSGLIFVVGSLNGWNIFSLGAGINELVSVHMISASNMGKIDMFHDGLSAKVYKSLEYATQRNSEILKEVTAETDEMIDQMQQKIKEFNELKVSDRIRDDLVRVDDPLRQYVSIVKGIVGLAADMDRDQALMRMKDFESAFSSLEKELASLSDDIEQEAARAGAKDSADASRSNLISLITLALGLALGLMAANYLTRETRDTLSGIAENLSENARKLSNLARDITSASGTLASATTEQSSAIEETVSSMEEMSAMISQTNQTASTTSSEASHSREGAADGKAVVARMVASVQEISASNDKLQAIVTVIDNIKSKTKIINDIAFETRLLAFNASIEAARAGSHGRGFAVVAEEVGKLASVSGKAADEVRLLLDGSISEVSAIVSETKKKVEEGERSSEHCESAFVRMHDGIVRIAQGIERIAAASKEQEVGVGQTNKAMIEMEKVTQTNSRAAESLASQATDLKAAADEMSESASLMSVLVFGSQDKRSLRQRPKQNRHHTASNDTSDSVGIEVKSVEPLREYSSATSGPSETDASVERSDSRWHAA